MHTLLAETAAHRAKLGSRISAIRNNSYGRHSRPAPVPKVESEPPKKAAPKARAIKVHKARPV